MHTLMGLIWEGKNCVLQWLIMEGFCREAEATSNLSAILTLSCLLTTYVIKRLGLALAEIDARGGWSDASKPAEELKAVSKTE